MREFSPPVAPILRLTVIELVDQIITLAPKELVSESAKVNLSEGVGQVAVARSEAIARPPFEWLVEVTSQINETDYLKHYLVRENDIVLAHRKVLTEVDDTEAEQLIRDLKQTLLALG
jgi:hypothetical protein